MSAKPKSPLSYYYVPLVAWALAIVAGFFIGGVSAAQSVMFLSMLEIALSFDNAAVNAKVLENWDARWRRIFLTVGIFVAVIGMRAVFPLLVVSVTTGMSLFAAGDLALEDPTKYASIMTSVHHQVSGFGAAFLLMVALNFFFAEKHVYWLEWVETKLTRFGQIEGVSAAATLMILLFSAGHFADAKMGQEFFMAGVWGVIVYILTHGLSTLIGGDEEDSTGAKIIRASIGGFLYLEALDASFSFDGVIGAFAVTNQLPIIILGLGVGALFVREMTIHLVDVGAMSEYRFLEHGAQYAIAVLAVIMIRSGMGLHLPEWVSGSLGVTLLGLALVHSIHVNRREAKQANLGYPAPAE